MLTVPIPAQKDILPCCIENMAASSKEEAGHEGQK